MDALRMVHQCMEGYCAYGNIQWRIPPNHSAEMPTAFHSRLFHVFVNDHGGRKSWNERTFTYPLLLRLSRLYWCSPFTLIVLVCGIRY
jgi:hypothetical protein